MNIVFFEESSVRAQLLPFTFTRTVADIRVGILTIREKWEHFLKTNSSSATEKYLADKFPLTLNDTSNFLINSSIIPTAYLMNVVQNIPLNTILIQNEKVIALHCGKAEAVEFLDKRIWNAGNTLEIDAELLVIENVWHIFEKSAAATKEDFENLTKNKVSEALSASNTVIGDKNQIFLEKGAKVEASILNTNAGPIYIAADAEIMEGSMIRGPFSVGEHSQIKMGTKVYGSVNIGPHCKIAGEINNSVVFGYSNKSHDGFLGNSVLGEWCNLGADTNTSNLKNNYSPVAIWSYAQNRMENTGLQFCGLMMGDYSKCGINTMFNTGTVVGVGANIALGEFPPKYIPSFTWMTARETVNYEFDKFLETASIVYNRRNLELTESEVKSLHHIYLNF